MLPTVCNFLPNKNPLNSDSPCPSVHYHTFVFLSVSHTHTHTQGGGVLASCSVWQITKCHTSGLYSVKTAEQNPHSGAGGGGGAKQEKHQTAAEGADVFRAQAVGFISVSLMS